MNPYHSDMELKERFIQKVYPEPNTGCWLWFGSYDKDGYGNFTINRLPVRSHRISYLLFKGEIGDKLVLHSCDVAGCVNPDHLFLGTHKDNINDKLSKNRGSKGENHGMSKLKGEQVREIRSSTCSNRKLAKKYNVDRKLIIEIKKHNIWKHII